jgi:hypothetical protein
MNQLITFLGFSHPLIVFSSLVLLLNTSLTVPFWKMANAVTPELSKEDSIFIVFVKFNGLAPSTLRKGLTQFECNISDDFNHLLHSVVQELTDSGQVDSSYASDILSYPVEVCHYPSEDFLANERVLARLSSSCAGLSLSQNRYVYFNFRPGPPTTLRKPPLFVDATSKLLQAQNPELG